MKYLLILWKLSGAFITNAYFEKVLEQFNAELTRTSTLNFVICGIDYVNVFQPKKSVNIYCNRPRTRTNCDLMFSSVPILVCKAKYKTRTTLDSPIPMFGYVSPSGSAVWNWVRRLKSCCRVENG